MSLLDLPATMLSAAGIEKPTGFRGRPLNHLTDGKAVDWQDEIFIQISETQTGRALRTPRWTYSVRAAEGLGDVAWADLFYEDFLYDNEADPAQRNNLVTSPEHEMVRGQLKERLLVRMEEAGEKVPSILPCGAR